MRSLKFEELLDIAIKKTLDEIKSNLDDALSESKKIVDSNYNKILADANAKINDLLAKQHERIEGERAKLDIEAKRSVLNEENYWLGKVYEEVVKKIDLIVNSPEYNSGIKEIIKREAREGSKIICAKQDYEKIKNILKDMKLDLQLSTDEKMLGGVKIYYPDVGLTRDYSLNLILTQVFEAEKPKIAKILFGE